MGETLAAGAVAERLGPDFRAVGAFVEHVPSGIVFAIVPGGEAVTGARAAEQAWFDDAAYLDDPVHAARIADGEIEVLRGARLACVPPVVDELRPFLLARGPMTRAEAERLGFVSTGRADAPRIFGARAEQPWYLLPGELEGVAAPPGFRLPDAAEWEHACRFGGEEPFRWGAEVPEAPVDPPHPLGLRALGWHRERCADGTTRGGAAALHPWQGGCAEWTLLLPSQRARPSSDPIDGQHAVRWALDVPGLPAVERAPRPLVEAPVGVRAAEATRALAAALASADAAAREAALPGVVGLAGRGVWSAQATHVLDPLLDALRRAADDEGPRLARAAATLFAGDPAAFSTTGFDPDREGWRSACATNAARVLRAALDARVEALVGLLGSASPVLRAHAAWLLPLAIPEDPRAADALAAAVAEETDEWALVSEALAHGIVARRCGRGPLLAYGRVGGPAAVVAAALGRLPLGGAPGEAEIDALVERMCGAPDEPDRFPWRGGRLDVAAALHVDAYAAGPLAGARLLARAVRRAGPEHPRVERFASGALALAFPRRGPVAAVGLGDAERAVLAELSAFDVPGAQVAAAFTRLGLPADAAARRRWLGA